MASPDAVLGGGLYETVRDGPGGVRAGGRHLARMRASARALGLPLPDEAAFLRALREAGGEGEAVRITLLDDGGAPSLAGVRRRAGDRPIPSRSSRCRAGSPAATGCASTS